MCITINNCINNIEEILKVFSLQTTIEMYLCQLLLRTVQEKTFPHKNSHIFQTTWPIFKSKPILETSFKTIFKKILKNYFWHKFLIFSGIPSYFLWWSRSLPRITPSFFAVFGLWKPFFLPDPSLRLIVKSSLKRLMTIDTVFLQTPAFRAILMKLHSGCYWKILIMDLRVSTSLAILQLRTKRLRN